MEKVISEFKVVETDDGFRIEIKGNKEVIRRMLEGLDPQTFFGGNFPFGRGSGFRFGFGPSFWSGFGNWGGWQGESEDEKKA